MPSQRNGETTRLVVAQVVTYVSRDGAYGGPVAVAKNQIRQLARSGHEVHVFGGWDGNASLQLEAGKTHLARGYSLIPGMRFASMVSPALWLKLLRLIRHVDVLHVHLARDLVTIPAAVIGILTGTRTCIQTHGMIVPDRRPTSRVIDIVVRWAFRRSHAHFVLTADERAAVMAVEPRRSNTVELRNGIAVESRQCTWNATPTVVFCSRLHPRKRVLSFVAMAERILTDGTDIDFLIFGPDGGDLGQLNDILERSRFSSRISYMGALEPSAVPEMLASVQALVLPSINEPYPMVVLEALAQGCPVIITDSNGLAPILGDRFPELVCRAETGSLAHGLSRLIQSRDKWDEYSQAAVQLARDEFSITAVTDRLLRAYRATRSEIEKGM